MWDPLRWENVGICCIWGFVPERKRKPRILSSDLRHLLVPSVTASVTGLRELEVLK